MKREKKAKAPAPPIDTPAAAAPAPAPAPGRKRRRRRRSAQATIAASVMSEIRKKKVAFLRDVSGLLTDALGFPVRVSLLRADKEAIKAMPPNMRRHARMSRRELAATFNGGPLDDDLPF